MERLSVFQGNESYDAELAVIRICNQDKFGHDRLKMDQNLPYFYTEKFLRDKIKKINSALCL